MLIFYDIMKNGVGFSPLIVFIVYIMLYV